MRRVRRFGQPSGIQVKHGDTVEEGAHNWQHPNRQAIVHPLEVGSAALYAPNMTKWPIPKPMQAALDAAAGAAKAGEVPVGAVIMRRSEVIAVAANATCNPPDPTGHAEIMALRLAAEKLGQDRLTDCDLYVTLEPCAMCAGAIAHARIARLYYAASDPKGGAVEHGARVFERAQTMHRPEVYSGMGAGEAAELLRDFFKERR